MFLQRGFSLLQSEHPLFCFFLAFFSKYFLFKLKLLRHNSYNIKNLLKNSTKNCVSDAFMSFLFLVGTFKPLLDLMLPQETNPSAINNTTFLSCQWFFYFVYFSCRFSDQCQLKICVVLRQHIHVADIFYIINANHKISKFIPKHLSKR